MNYRLASAVAAVLAASPTQVVWAQAAPGGGLEEVVVTAQRRAESLQDVPLSIQALTGETLSQLNVSTVEEFVRFLPSVTTATLGPGQTNIYMRGLSVGTLGTQGSGTNGPWPNVAVYLDDQSTQVPGRNLDVYAADFERIEVLTGPQGTLFGAGAQAGVLRYITNKPRFNEMSANVKAGLATTAHGGESYNVEAMANVPLIDDKLALRVVAYHDNRGGYIDNVYSTFTRNGTDLGFARRTGGVVPADSLVINNGDIDDNDINTVEYNGARASLKWQVTDDWDALLAVAYQKIEGEGVFYQHPNGSESGCGATANCTTSTQKLKQLEVTIFNEGFTEDEFINTALTVNGKVGPLDLVYTGAYLTREAQSISDYTNYARGVWGTYYQCTGYSGASVDQVLHAVELLGRHVRQQEPEPGNPPEQSDRLAHALRRRPVLRRSHDRGDHGLALQVAAGVPGHREPGRTASATSIRAQDPKFQSAVADMNNPNRRASDIGFFNDFTRDYTQFAAFASVDFDILENLTLTLGTRYFDIENSMVGANMGSFYCKVYGTGERPCTAPARTAYGTNVTEQEDNNNQADGFRSRANLTWRVNDDVLLYTTWSEGYRPGGFNRGSACGVKDPVNQRPTSGASRLSYESDDLTNYELGWKTSFWGGRAQFNGAIYHVEWESAQTGLFAPQLGFPNLQSFLTGPNYTVDGIELNFVVAPMDGLVINAAGSYNKARTGQFADVHQQQSDQPDLRRADHRVVPRRSRAGSAPSRAASRTSSARRERRWRTRRKCSSTSARGTSGPRASTTPTWVPRSSIRTSPIRLRSR